MHCSDALKIRKLKILISPWSLGWVYVFSRAFPHARVGSELMHCRLQRLEEQIVTCDAKLVIIDSVASVVRKEYDPTINHNMAERSGYLARVAAILKHAAEAFSIPVCVCFSLVILFSTLSLILRHVLVSCLRHYGQPTSHPGQLSHPSFWGR